MKKKLGLFEKMILAGSLALILAGAGLLTLIVYNGINGYSALDLPDRKVSFSIKEEGLNIHTEGSVRSRGADKVLSALEKMGPITKEQARYGIILISSTTIPQGHNDESVYSGDPEEYRTAGFYSVPTKMIVVNDAKNADFTMCHEMGHFVDHNLYDGKLISDTKEWRHVLETEYPRTGWDLYYSDPQEYFAESFAYYYTDPEKLSGMCPRTYEIIERTVGEYYGSK